MPGSGIPLRRFMLMAWILVAFCLLPCQADTNRETYELRGTVVRADDGKPIRGSYPTVFLKSVSTPFTTSTLAGPSGKFNFKNLSPSPYRLTIAVPNWGRMEKSIDIGPSFADAKNRIEMEFKFKPDYQTDEHEVVSLKQLTIPDKARRKYQEALKELEKKKPARAIEILQEVVRIAPHYSDAWNRLGTIAFVSSEFTEAETYFRAAIDHDPNSFSPVVNLGATLYALGKMKESLRYNRKAVSMEPGDPLANSQLGLSYLALKKLSEAEDFLLKCKAIDPAHFSHPQVSLAELYRQRRDTTGMARELKEFIHYHPDDERVQEFKKIIAEIENGTDSE